MSRGSSHRWKIYVDTGGTFTDCIAQAPDGRVLRLKVLSSGTLRGTLLQRLGPRRFRFAHKWHFPDAPFQGYRLRFGGRPMGAIEELDLAAGTLLLDRDFPLEAPGQFELSGDEEAPVLAARLATRTPLHRPLPPLEFHLGTTRGTNALLEKKGCRVALLITRGFADLPFIGTQQRPHLFQLDIPDPVLLHRHVFEVAERIDARGRVLEPLTDEELQRLLEALRETAPEAIAVSLMHAWRNPAHERQLKAALEAAGFVNVCTATELSTAIKFYPRTQTALVNAYLQPLLSDYLSRIRAAMQSGSTLRVMKSSGGLSAAEAFHPKDSLLSGPAAGVVGAVQIARRLGFDRILTLDMGGTSTDTARYDGRYDYRFTTRVGGVELHHPSLAIETVAAGGGSICWFDGHRLRVGPESAGAAPGPACYGNGGPLALTDVNLLLGKLDPALMGIPVSRDAARQALHEVRAEVERKTGRKHSEETLLRGFERIANELMAGAIRRISVRRGFDPRSYALVVFGGAGGLHACRIADLLGMRTVVLPYDAGLLSAWGLGHAQTEQLESRQVLLPFEACREKLGGWFAELEERAREALEKQGFGAEEIEVRSRWLHLRFRGQESSLEVPFSTPEAVLPAFRQRYRHLFGHYPEEGVPEVESLKLLAAAPRREAPMQTEGVRQGEEVRVEGCPLIQWDELEPGQIVPGPCLLLNYTSSAYVEAGWELACRSGRDLVLRRVAEEAAPEREAPPAEAVELELFTRRFESIAEEMGAQLQRTAFSTNVKERLDFSCALLDPRAELLVNAPHIPVHLGSLGICARLVLQRFPLRPGDVILTNHPAFGGSHLPDLTLLSAVHTPQGELVGYVINRAHHAEIGGRRPGSMPPDARTLEEEGVVIPPFYLVQGGRVRWQELRRLLLEARYPTRALEANLADINAALAALRSGSEKLLQLVDRHGLGRVHHYMAALKESAAGALEQALEPYRGRELSAEERLDDGSPLRVRIHVGPEKVRFDFTGTAPRHPFNLNANLAIVNSVVIYVLRLLCRRPVPLNEGLMQRVELHLPEDSLLHPRFPEDPARCPAVVGGNTEVSQRLVDTLLKAFGLAACSQGTMNNFLFGNERYSYYETIGGGVGAGEGFHGRSAVHQHMTNTRITDPEELEFRFPVRLRAFSIRKGSGGAGKWRGGDGIVRELEFLEAMEFTLLTQHRVESPYGLQGGSPGKVGAQYLLTPDGRTRPLKGIEGGTVEPGARIRIETPGGGGYGLPEGGAEES